MKKKIALGVIVLVAAGFIGKQLIGLRSKMPQYQTAKVERGTIVSSVAASGKALTANIVSVTTGASGIVKKVYVKDGDSVTAGDNIAELALDQAGMQKNSQAWASYLSAKNTVESAKVTFLTLQSDMLTKWKAYMDLAQSGSYQQSDGSPKTDARRLPQFFTVSNDWLAAEAKYKNQQAVVDQAQAALVGSWASYRMSAPIITAPIAGTVGSVGLVEGMVVGQSNDTTATSSQRVAVIQNEAYPLVSVSVTEVDVPKLQLGQKATVTVDSIADKTFTGVVKTVDRLGTTSNNVTTYPITIQLDTKVPELLPNMAVLANVMIETKTDVLIVPSAAVQTADGSPMVRILRGGREEVVPIEPGISSDTRTEIVSGINEGDEVITATAASASLQSATSSVFGGGFGGGMFRVGGVGGAQRR